MLTILAHRLPRFLIAVLVLAALTFAGIVLALRYWLLPNIAEYRDAIATSISQAAGQKVVIGAIDAGWDGLRPHLVLRQVDVLDRSGVSALSFAHVETTLAWWSLARGEIRLHSLEIDRPILDVRRGAGGEVFVGGVWVNQPGSDSGFVDWVLRQHRIIVRGATVNWRDEMRQAPLLELGNVHLRLENRGQHHRFGLRAVPPRALALPLDIRGDLKGDALADLASWSGQLYARLDHTDLAAWRNWLDLPFAVERGSGGVRLWLTLGERQVRGLTADVQLNDVLARTAPELPQLKLRQVTGRMAWRELDPGRMFEITRLGFSLQHGPVFAPASARVTLLPARGKKPAEGELEIDGLELEPLAALADYFPLPDDGREKLRQIQPAGQLAEIKAKWRGNWDTPQQYGVKGRFANLAARSYSLASGQTLPGVSGLSGSLDVNEKGGSIALNGKEMKLNLAGIFDHVLALDTLTAQLAWIHKGDQHEFRLASAAFSNDHLAGTAFGSYRSDATGPGRIDLSGQLTRADARYVSHYLPLVVGVETRQWLARALKAGRSSDVRLRLKGDLAEFPFVDGKSGLFEVSARADQGILEYAPEWPLIEDVAVDLLFRGKRMDIFAHSGSTYGMKISKVHAQIPDLLTMDEMLLIDGEAQGPTAGMLKFVAQSPVNGMIDGFTEDMRATGNGKFNLGLKIPLRRLDEMSVAGGYDFLQNRVELGSGMPALEQVNGSLKFTGSSVEVPAITAQFLGGPASISAATRQGVVQVNASGRATAEGLRHAFALPWFEHLRGGAKWNGQVILRKKLADAVFSSNLQGLASDLPLPFNKPQGDSVLLRLERKATSTDQDSIVFSYGKTLAAQMERRRLGNEMQIERGSISLGGGMPKLPAKGIWLSGSLPYFDLDHWRALAGPAQGNAALPGLNGINLQLGVLDAFGKRFNELRLNASVQGDGWQGVLESREMNGKVSWETAGAGRVSGRFRSLAIPSAAPPKLSESPVQAPPPEEDDLPALDIIADSFTLHGKQLGRLELLAAPSGRDWRIEKLKLNTPESSLTLDGVWQDWLQQPRSRVNLELETSDIGRLLARLGHPDSVKGGNALLKGQFTWAGSPTEFNYATLSGLMSLEAHKGQFLKVEPGLGKLLGVLSLQALPRRITLDFRDVFSDGFMFDDISGDMKVHQGIVSGKDFTMFGPSARVNMSGETDLMRETQDLHVRVVPLLGDSVSGAAALLGGPVIGLTTLLVQKMLKDPLGQLIAYEYSIGGTWDNPVVTKLKREKGENEAWGEN